MFKFIKDIFKSDKDEDAFVVKDFDYTNWAKKKMIEDELLKSSIKVEEKLDKYLKEEFTAGRNLRTSLNVVSPTGLGQSEKSVYEEKISKLEKELQVLKANNSSQQDEIIVKTVFPNYLIIDFENRSNYEFSFEIFLKTLFSQTEIDGYVLLENEYRGIYHKDEAVFYSHFLRKDLVKYDEEEEEYYMANGETFYRERRKVPVGRKTHS